MSMQLLYEHTQHLELSMDKIGDEQENSSRYYKIFDKYELFRMINQLENFENSPIFVCQYSACISMAYL